MRDGLCYGGCSMIPAPLCHGFLFGVAAGLLLLAILLHC